MPPGKVPLRRQPLHTLVVRGRYNINRSQRCRRGAEVVAAADHTPAAACHQHVRAPAHTARSSSRPHGWLPAASTWSDCGFEQPRRPGKMQPLSLAAVQAWSGGGVTRRLVASAETCRRRVARARFFCLSPVSWMASDRWHPQRSPVSWMASDRWYPQR